MMPKLINKISKMTREQEIKDALKAIRCYEREKKAGKLKVARTTSDFFK